MSIPATAPKQAVRALNTKLFRYAVIDLASAPEARPSIARLLPSASEPLFARTVAQELLDVGPWLVRLSKAPEIELMLANMSPEVPWGYYVHTLVDIVSLRQTLQRFNLALVPGHPQVVLFRYWDPRVMKVFLESATSHQRRMFFEFIDAVEAADWVFEA